MWISSLIRFPILQRRVALCSLRKRASLLRQVSSARFYPSILVANRIRVLAEHTVAIGVAIGAMQLSYNNPFERGIVLHRAEEPQWIVSWLDNRN